MCLKAALVLESRINCSPCLEGTLLFIAFCFCCTQSLLHSVFVALCVALTSVREFNLTQVLVGKFAGPDPGILEAGGGGGQEFLICQAKKKQVGSNFHNDKQKTTGWE